jgi:hypothetical protein
VSGGVGHGGLAPALLEQPDFQKLLAEVETRNKVRAAKEEAESK